MEGMNWEEEFLTDMPDYEHTINIEDRVRIVHNKAEKWWKTYSGQLVKVSFENHYEDKYKFLKFMNKYGYINKIYYSIEDSEDLEEYADTFIFVKFI